MFGYLVIGILILLSVFAIILSKAGGNLEAQWRILGELVAAGRHLNIDELRDRTGLKPDEVAGALKVLYTQRCIRTPVAVGARDFSSDRHHYHITEIGKSRLRDQMTGMYAKPSNSP